jgi:hypothetical protein
MDFKEAYKFPLSYDGGFVFTADYNRAFDFANGYIYDNPVNVSTVEQKRIVAKINGADIDVKYDLSYDYKSGTLIHDGKDIIVIRGWGHLTGTGGLRLSEEQAEKIQDDFAEFIIKRLA